MKRSNNLVKENGVLLSLFVGSCLLFYVFYSPPQSFSLRNLNWMQKQMPSTHHIDRTIIPSNSNVDPEKNSIANTTFDDGSENNEEALSSKPICDYSDWRSDICYMTGDIRTNGYNNSTIFFVPPADSFVPKEQEWRVNPYSQKMYTYLINYVTVKQLQGPQGAPTCTVIMNVPAILLSIGGPSAPGNIWHAFTDVLIPLFLASKQFGGEVQLLISSYHQDFIDKHSLIIKDLTRYEIINFDEDREVRCYPQMTVGLLNHRDFGIDPERAFDRFDMYKFRLYIRNTYSLPVDVDIPYKIHDSLPDKKPRLMLIFRSSTRKFLNKEEIEEAITTNGFELVQMDLKNGDDLTKLSKVVDSCDVLMGIHGAGLTNIVFLRTNAVMIQVIPLGGSHMNNAAHGYYDRPAQEMKLRTIDYTITVEESSLLDKYGWDHPAVKDPEAVAARGWQDRHKYYWFEQDVRLNVARFEPVLIEALELLQK
ncbi:EGF domain-specific O-linked N-acetylglucosamine transferase [Rhynchospora pubera]|uniref:EGF domain-specific O-linked N-acetylglucosamine transferase n=1 Tax=Rhynchospora pubera TaxID=906938 RepID=A0AAV8ETU3_9POAL|nr:EGF domain-specific O-linked N-acetylglucosamine transferase [Rhynchospora pubera]